MRNKQRILQGLRNINDKKWKIVFPLIYLIVVMMIWSIVRKNVPFSEISILSKTCRCFLAIFIIGIIVAGEKSIIQRLGTPYIARKIERSFLNIRFDDYNGDVPVLLSVLKEEGIVTLEFFSPTISKSKYLDCQDELETALNMQILSIEQGKDKRHVKINGTLAENHLPDIAEWDDSYLSGEEFNLLIGISQFGKESIDINTTPHTLVGGGSGSGKSKLLKLLLMQCIKKNAVVKLCDFKGGVDYPDIWHEKCSIITTPESMNEQLADVLTILEERRQLLRESKHPNIYEYNKVSDKKINRIIVACDEVAEVLDKTGLDKEQKSLVAQIESKMAKIARLGRAFGIHLMLATQRPDKEILKGQIKDNVGYRICGRADKVLSQIILDNSDGADMIPQDAQGVFLTNTKVLFKAFYVHDDCLERERD
ncbi:MAG: DUF87 domain-containing protein [Lachnospiraceae bacterium]